MNEQITISALYDLNETIAADIFKDCTYPWEVLAKIGDFIKELGKTLPRMNTNSGRRCLGCKEQHMFIRQRILTVRVLSAKRRRYVTAHLSAARQLSEEGAVVGNSTELKNVILFNKVQVPHYNYVGDSILGYKAHMGAGSITSNVKSDKKLITIKAPDMPIDTGIKKIGAFLGDGVEVGCGSVLNPGTIVGRNSNIYPLSSVRGFVPAGSIYKNKTEIVEKNQ